MNMELVPSILASNGSHRSSGLVRRAVALSWRNKTTLASFPRRCLRISSRNFVICHAYKVPVIVAIVKLFDHYHTWAVPEKNSPASYRQMESLNFFAVCEDFQVTHCFVSGL